MTYNDQVELFLSVLPPKSGKTWLSIGEITSKVNRKIKPHRINELAALTVCKGLVRDGYLLESSVQIPITNSAILEPGFYTISIFARNPDKLN